MRLRAKRTVRNDCMIVARKAKGLSQSRLVIACGSTLRNIMQLERLDYSMAEAEETAIRVSLFLGIPVEQVMPLEAAGRNLCQDLVLVRDVDASRVLDSSGVASRLLPSTIDVVVENERRKMTRRGLRSAIHTLAYREREVLKLRFGLDGGRVHTLAECGQIFKISQEAIRQIEKKAIRKLRHPVRRRLIAHEAAEQSDGYAAGYPA